MSWDPRRRASVPNLREPGWMRTLVLAGIGLAVLLGLAAVGVAVLGRALSFDAARICAFLGAVAVLAGFVPPVFVNFWWSRERLAYAAGAREEDEYAETEVPERDAIRDRARRTMLSRIDAQRFARQTRDRPDGDADGT